MTPAQTELARMLVASERWEWHGGMSYVFGLLVDDGPYR